MCRFLPRALSLETLAPANSSRIAFSAGSRLTAISLASLLALRQSFILAQLTISSLVSRRSEHNRSASSGSNTFSDNSSGHPHSSPSTSFVSGVYTHPAAASARDETMAIRAKGFMGYSFQRKYLPNINNSTTTAICMRQPMSNHFSAFARCRRAASRSPRSRAERAD